MLNRIFTICFGFLCVFLCYLLYSVFEYYEEDKDLGWGREALKNPYLALELYIDALGGDVKVTDSFLELGELDQYQFIHISNSDLVLSETRILALLSWVDAGGILVVGTSLNDHDSDRFLSRLNFSLFEGEDSSSVSSSGDDDSTDLEDDSPEAIAAKIGDELRRHNKQLNDEQHRIQSDTEILTDAELIERYEQGVDDRQLTLLSFDGVDGDLQAELDNSVDIYHPAMSDDQWLQDGQELLYWSGTDYGVHFAQLKIGAGMISVFSGTGLFSSRSIGNFDHAYLWPVLSNGGQSAVLYGSNMPSLWSILKKMMPELLLTVVLLLFFGLWSMAGYFGSKREFSVTSRRAFHEHLTASAGFYWRHKWQQKLLTPVRADIIAAARISITGFDACSSSEQANVLAKHCDIDEAIVHKVMYGSEQMTDDGFTKAVQILQRLRGAL